MLDFYSHEYPVARKIHKCEFCHCNIPRGQRYSYESGKYDGDFFVRKLCPECNAILSDYCDEYSYDEFEWTDISDWLKDRYCYDCPKKYECDAMAERCEIVKDKYPHEIPKRFYEIVHSGGSNDLYNR
jgi:hypothetical protein